MLRLYQPPLICTMVFFTRWLEILGEFVFFFVKQGNRKKQQLLVFTVHRLILLMLVVSPPPHPAPLLARKNPCFIHILKKNIFSIIIVYHDGKNMNADCACIQQNIKQKYLLYRFCKTVQ